MKQLFEKLNKEAQFFSDLGKEHFGRKRPCFQDPRIKPVLRGLSDPSYPSGHGTRGMLYGACWPSSRRAEGGTLGAGRRSAGIA